MQDDQLPEHPTASRDLIVRIDERTRTMQKTLDDTSSKLTGVEARVSSLESKFSEMGPVKMIVFGGVGFILLSVLGALLAYVVYTGANK